MIELYHTDAVNLLASLQPDSVNCIHFDGPYGMQYQSYRRKWNERLQPIKGDTVEDAHLLHTLVINEAARVLLPGAACFVWTSLTRRSAWEVLASLLQLEHPMQLLDKVVWNKQSGGTGWQYRKQYEECLHLFKAADIVYGIDKLEYKHKAVWRGGKSQTNVIDQPRRRLSKEDNATEKPIQLLFKLLSTVLQPGDLLVDPVCGSGTSLETAHRLGCRAIGSDIDEKTIELTYTRLKQQGIPVEIKQLENKSSNQNGKYYLKAHELWSVYTSYEVKAESKEDAVHQVRSGQVLPQKVETLGNNYPHKQIPIIRRIRAQQEITQIQEKFRNG